MEYYYLALKRTKSESVVVRWMDLEPVIQSEVSHKEKNKYHILKHIYGILKPTKKNGTDGPICRTVIDTDIGKRFVDVVGEEKGGMN